jgi:hypothetical protein
VNRDLAKINLSDVARTAAGDLLSAAFLNALGHCLSVMGMMLSRVRVATGLLVHRAIWRSSTAVCVRSLEAHANRGDRRDGDLERHGDYRSRADQPAADAHTRVDHLSAGRVREGRIGILPRRSATSLRDISRRSSGARMRHRASARTSWATLSACLSYTSSPARSASLAIVGNDQSHNTTRPTKGSCVATMKGRSSAEGQLLNASTFTRTNRSISCGRST